ncbi:MAG: acyl-CoA dehydrogenase family protein [Methylotetracoccus sp.]
MKTAAAVKPQEITTSELFERAERLAAEFALTAAERDRAGGTAKKERDSLRESGLLTASISRSLGGYGLGWQDTLRLVRIIARADSALAHLFGFQHLLLATVRLFGDQWEYYHEQTVLRRWFWGNALNPLDTRAELLRDGPDWLLRGAKSFCSGAMDSDCLIVSANAEGSGKLVVAAIPSNREGLRINADWDNMGQRQTDSGSVEFENVRIYEREILRNPGPLGSIFASLRSLIAQMVLTNIYLGIAEGALADARNYTLSQSRAWFLSGVERQTEDPYVRRKYGEFLVELHGAALATDHAASLLEQAWSKEDALSESERSEVAVASAIAKVAASQGGLDITQRLFEVTGARATSTKAGLDRYWRNLRTHTLHDPVDYKLRDLGDWLLNGKPPIPSFYS